MIEVEFERIGLVVDSWIAEEDLAVSPQLKVIRKYDFYRDWDEDEIAAHREFISWYLGRGHELMMTIPAAESTTWHLSLMKTATTLQP